MSRRRAALSRRPVGRDGAGNLGRRHLDKYAEPPARRPRDWCDAGGGGRYCSLPSGHDGPHKFERGQRR